MFARHVGAKHGNTSRYHPYATENPGQMQTGAPTEVDEKTAALLEQERALEQQRLQAIDGAALRPVPAAAAPGQPQQQS